jgi:hypothetical protein
VAAADLSRWPTAPPVAPRAALARDELARLFHQAFRPTWRTKALEHLRSGGGAGASRQAPSGEVFVVHTHPVMRSSPGHFGVDLARADKHVEAVIDWSGLVTYYNKAGIKNPRNAGGWLEPLRGYESAFLDKNNNIIGFARIDLIDGPTGTHIRVQE